MNTTSHTEELAASEPIGKPRTRRLLLAGLGFIAFEALFIWLLGDKVYDFTYFSLGMLGLIALASSGYFALGFFSRSLWSVFFLVAPVLVAAYFVNVVWTTEFSDGTGVGVNSNFVEVWMTLSFMFVPAWALGILSAGGRSSQD